MQALLLKIFIAIGGIAIVLKFADNLLPQMIGKAFLGLLKAFPGAKQFILENHDQLIKIARDSEAELEKDINDTK